MSHIAEITVKHPDLTLTPTLEAIPDLQIEIESQPATASDSPVLFYSVETPDFQTFESELDADHTIIGWQSVSKFQNYRIYRVHLSSEVKIISPKMTEQDLRILSATNGDGGWHLRLQAPDRERLVQFQNYCHKEDVTCQIHKLYSTTAQNKTPGIDISIQLTDRQHEVAQTATEMGYFDQDGASAKEVSEELDITASTLSSHLRTITAKMFKQFFNS